MEQFDVADIASSYGKFSMSFEILTFRHLKVSVGSLQCCMENNQCGNNKTSARNIAVSKWPKSESLCISRRFLPSKHDTNIDKSARDVKQHEEHPVQLCGGQTVSSRPEPANPRHGHLRMMRVAW